MTRARVGVSRLWWLIGCLADRLVMTTDEGYLVFTEDGAELFEPSVGRRLEVVRDPVGERQR